MSPIVGVKAVMKRMKSSRLITPPSGLQNPPGGLFARKISVSRSKLLSNDTRESILLTRTLSDRSLALLGQRQTAAPWAICPSEFNQELVRSKSLNLQRLVALGLSEWIRTPVSVAIPNGAMRKVMNFETNSDLRQEYESLLQGMVKAKVGDVKCAAS